MRRNHGLLVVFSWVACLLFFSWRSAQKDYTSADVDFDELFERLHRAERRAAELTAQLSLVVKGLHNASQQTNTSFDHSLDGDFRVERPNQGTVNNSIAISSPPSFSYYLPHLRQHKDNLVAQVHLGRGRTGVSLVLGIPTVHRQKQSYLVSTVASLLYDLPSKSKDDMLIIIFVAETNMALVKKLAEEIQVNFAAEVNAGLLEVVSPPASYYPDLTQLRSTFNDPPERVRWRTKQNLDFSFLMMYAHSKGTYYVQLEDDIVAKLGYSETIMSFTTRLSTEEWLFLEFSQLGFIGKLFRSSDLPMIVEFFLMFHKDKPIDWLLDHILWVKVCNPEKDAKHCNSEKSRMKKSHKPSLFQHVGLHSSLAGKVQNLKDKDFGKQLQFIPHANPDAELSSSLKHYQTHTLERAYRGQDFFWGLTPTVGDYVLISFTQPQRIQEYLFRSGNIETNGDRFYNTTVEVMPSNESILERVKKGEFPKYQPSAEGFIIVGSFVNGVAEGEVDAAIETVSAIRLVVHADSDVWVLLSEIFIKV